MSEDSDTGRLSSEDVEEIKAASDAYLEAMRGQNWRRVAESFAADGVRIPPHEHPHQGRDALEQWLGGIEELVSYELTRDALDGAGGFAYIRGSYAITLRPKGAPDPISDEGDYLEVWQRQPDSKWQIAEAIWNTRSPLAS